MTKKLSYNHTVAACSISYMVQAIVNNYAPLLFITFNKEYNIPLEQIALLITLNFSAQLLIDFLSGFLANKIGYRRLIYIAHIASIVGFWFLAILPEVINPFIGLVISVITYGVGGGLLEVLISPVVEAGPGDEKSKVMSFLHSFYSWGQLLVILLSTLFFQSFGLENRIILTLLWTIIPMVNLIYFKFVPVNTLEDNEEGMTYRELLKNKTFYLMIVLMICSGASELGISQWASAFAEAGLGVSKTFGDILGPCMFAVFMGLSRVFYSVKGDKLQLEAYTFLCSILCFAGYIIAALVRVPIVALAGVALCGFSVGVMWPGTYVYAHKKIPNSGTSLFALLALAGDLGCSSGPSAIGFVSGAFNDSLNAGILAGSIFPLIMAVVLGAQIFKRSSEVDKNA